MRISDWSSDVCSSDLELIVSRKPTGTLVIDDLKPAKNLYLIGTGTGLAPFMSLARDPDVFERFAKVVVVHGVRSSEEHTSELQSLMRISYAVFCLTKKLDKI